MSNAIRISNNISRGRVNAFDPNSGGFLGPLRDANGNPIEIDNVWALQFGQGGGPNGSHNHLFFAGDYRCLKKKGLTVNEQIASLSVNPSAGSFIRDTMRLLTSYDSMEMSINIDQFSCVEKLAT